MSKPTMQDIADALSVSRITVWKALSNRPGVSDSMRAQIHQKSHRDWAISTLPLRIPLRPSLLNCLLTHAP